MPTSPTQDDAQRLHKDPESVRRFLDQLDANAEPADEVNARRSDRYRYRVQSLGVELAQRGAAWVRYEVPSRNLSREGAAFLLGHYVYPGTACRIHLVSPQNQRQTVNARVIRCRYLEGSATLHEVGVQFDQGIDVAMYNRQVTRLRVLLVTDDPSMHCLIGHWAKSLDVELAHAENGCRAAEMAATSHFDLVLLDVELPGRLGIETARDLRRQGFARTIVAVSARAGEEWHRECLAAGCNDSLVKPISHDDLVQLIESHQQKPLFSSVARDESFVELIDTFVMELPGKVGRLESAYAKNDFKTLAVVTRILKGEGGAYGFQPITDAAAEVERDSSDLHDMTEIRSRLNELIRVCLSARSTRYGDGA